jgi:hypothetical protein
MKYPQPEISRPMVSFDMATCKIYIIKGVRRYSVAFIRDYSDCRLAIFTLIANENSTPHNSPLTP